MRKHSNHHTCNALSWLLIDSGQPFLWMVPPLGAVCRYYEKASWISSTSLWPLHHRLPPGPCPDEFIPCLPSTVKCCYLRVICWILSWFMSMPPIKPCYEVGTLPIRREGKKVICWNKPFPPQIVRVMMLISTIETLRPQISKPTKPRIVQGKTSCAVTLPGLNIKYPQSGEIPLLILSVLDGKKRSCGI